MGYRPGDIWMYCDRTGLKTRRSQMVKQWDGLWVRREVADPYHPLDTALRYRPERVPRETRPEPGDIFLDPGDIREEDLFPVSGIGWSSEAFTLEPGITDDKLIFGGWYTEAFSTDMNIEPRRSWGEPETQEW